MTRVLTAAVAIPLVVALVLFTPDWIFALAVGLVAALAAEEFLSLGTARGIGRPGQWFLVPTGLVAASFIGGAEWALTCLAGATILLLSVTVFASSTEAALGTIGIGLSSLVYCGLTLGFLILLPRELILLVFAIIWTGDSAAYYAGKSFGRHRLAPR